jgi:hypothetical protein
LGLLPIIHPLPRSLTLGQVGESEGAELNRG